MSRRDDRDPTRKARRRESDTTMVSDGMDWSNPMMWQHKPNINPRSSTPQSQTNYLQPPSPPLAQLHHSAPCFHQCPLINYSMPFPPEPEPTKNMKTTIDEVVQWRTLSTFLETLTFVSACWWFCFPELPRPPAPADLNNLAT